MNSILFVDDDEDVRDVVGQMLGPRGYFVHAVATAEAALVILKGNIRFDVLLTDIVMPGGLNGFELAAEAIRLQPALRVLYVTGFGNLLPRGTIKLYAKIISKPFQHQQLDAEIRKLLVA